MFHDVVTLWLESGKGGDGAVSFRREKFIPRGGPDGGDGGKGGDVYLVATRQLSELGHLASVRELEAEKGVPGAGKKLFGRKGEDLTVTVPVGTRVFRKIGDDWRLVTEMMQEDKPFRLLVGGKGGLGNVHFATATHRTPRHAEPGEPSQRAEFKFELQLIADAGIIGKPNAGKSTFLSIISDAKPKIGNYPFTTLSPVLGVVEHHNVRRVFADIPGLIEGASEGKGLGHTFLRHVTRTKVLIHFIDALSADYAHDYTAIRDELRRYSPELGKKLEIVVITKSETITDESKEEFEEKVAALKNALEPSSKLFTGVMISSVTKENVPKFLDEVYRLIGAHA